MKSTAKDEKRDSRPFLLRKGLSFEKEKEEKKKLEVKPPAAKKEEKKDKDKSSAKDKDKKEKKEKDKQRFEERRESREKDKKDRSSKAKLGDSCEAGLEEDKQFNKKYNSTVTLSQCESTSTNLALRALLIAFKSTHISGKEIFLLSRISFQLYLIINEKIQDQQLWRLKYTQEVGSKLSSEFNRLVRKSSEEKPSYGRRDSEGNRVIMLKKDEERNLEAVTWKLSFQQFFRSFQLKTEERERFIMSVRFSASIVLQRILRKLRTGNLDEFVNDFFVEDKEKLTALHLASKNNDIDIIRILLRSGANIKLESSNHLTPLETAKLFASSEATTVLQEAHNQTRSTAERNSFIVPFECLSFTDQAETIRCKLLAFSSPSFFTTGRVSRRTSRGTSNNEYSIKCFVSMGQNLNWTKLLKFSELDHPNLVSYVGFSQTIENYFLVMETAPKGSLLELMRKMKKDSSSIPLQLSISLLIQVCRGLLHLEETALFHGNLKPSNILLFSGSENTEECSLVKLSDYSLDGIFDQDCLNLNSWFPYSPPEYFKRQKLGIEADVYSLAVILWQMFSLESPFRQCRNPIEVSSLIINGERPSPIPSSCPPQIKTLLPCCWDTNTAQRPKLRNVLQALLQAKTEDLFGAADNNQGSTAEVQKESQSGVKNILKSASKSSLEARPSIRESSSTAYGGDSEDLYVTMTRSSSKSKASTETDKTPPPSPNLLSSLNPQLSSSHPTLSSASLVNRLTGNVNTSEAPVNTTSSTESEKADDSEKSKSSPNSANSDKRKKSNYVKNLADLVRGKKDEDKEKPKPDEKSRFSWSANQPKTGGLSVDSQNSMKSAEPKKQQNTENGNDTESEEGINTPQSSTSFTTISSITTTTTTSSYIPSQNFSLPVIPPVVEHDTSYSRPSSNCMTVPQQPSSDGIIPSQLLQLLGKDDISKPNIGSNTPSRNPAQSQPQIILTQPLSVYPPQTSYNFAQPQTNPSATPPQYRHPSLPSNIPSHCSFLQLSDKLILKLFGYFRCPDMVALGLTCKRMFHVMNSNQLWRDLWKSDSMYKNRKSPFLDHKTSCMFFYLGEDELLRKNQMRTSTTNSVASVSTESKPRSIPQDAFAILQTRMHKILKIPAEETERLRYVLAPLTPAPRSPNAMGSRGAIAPSLSTVLSNLEKLTDFFFPIVPENFPEQLRLPAFMLEGTMLEGIVDEERTLEELEKLESQGYVPREKQGPSSKSSPSKLLKPMPVQPQLPVHPPTQVKNPHNLVTIEVWKTSQVLTVVCHPYFHGFDSLDNANRKLAPAPPGSYLFRFSSMPGYIVLDIRVYDKVKHMRIRITRDRKFRCGNLTFISIDEICDYFVDNSPIEDEMETLIYPIKRK